MTKERLEGVLPVMKPAGWTSHDVVAKVRRLVGMKRIGHTGTLDPQVTGVLPLCLGRATRIVEYIQDLPKEYEATVVIGLATDTEDLTGQVIDRANSVTVTEADLRAVLPAFVGEIEQVPPMYSAVKIDGKRLYEIARSGKQVERKARTVTIFELELLGMNLQAEKPELTFRVMCSKGTYIRTLCVDLGRKLGYPAAMKRLVRTRTGHIGLADTLDLDQIAELADSGRLQERLIPSDRAIAHLPCVKLPDHLAVQASQGRFIHLSSASESLQDQDGKTVRVYDTADRFIGLFQWEKTKQMLLPRKVFC